MKTFKDQSLHTIISYMQSQLKENNDITFYVLNPDLCQNCYSGQNVSVENENFTYRSLKSYLELADFFKLHFSTPLAHKHLIKLHYKKIPNITSFHEKNDIENKYGSDSIFAQINKNEESSYLLYFLQALSNANLKKKERILNLGVNKADEFEVIKNLHPNFDLVKLYGIDFCQSAIDMASEKFANGIFYTHNINAVESLALKPFDLIISIATLQSPQIDFEKTLKYMIKNLLQPKGSVILGFPNSRWISGDLFYGAKAKNYSFNELSLLFKDVNFAKRYLQQHNFRVMITGKDYIFLTAKKL